MDESETETLVFRPRLEHGETFQIFQYFVMRPGGRLVKNKQKEQSQTDTYFRDQDKIDTRLGVLSLMCEQMNGSYNLMDEQS